MTNCDLSVFIISFYLLDFMTMNFSLKRVKHVEYKNKTKNRKTM